MREVNTWHDILEYLQEVDKIQPELLDKPPQIMLSNVDGDKPIPLDMIIDIGKVIDYCSCAVKENIPDKTRSSYDNENHPEDIVLLCDRNPYGEDGKIFYDL